MREPVHCTYGTLIIFAVLYRLEFYKRTRFFNKVGAFIHLKNFFLKVDYCYGCTSSIWLLSKLANVCLCVHVR